MRIRTSTTSGLLLVVMTQACTIERTPRDGRPDPESVARAEIAATLHNYQQALIEGNPRRVASFFTPDARLSLPDAHDIIGRGPIDNTMMLTFEHGRMLEVALQSDALDVGNDVATQFGTMRQRVIEGEGAERTLNGRFAIRWVKGAESTWRIDRLLINDVPADSAALASDS